MAEGNFKYAISFTDHFSGFIFVYFLKAKSDAILATKQFLADCAPFGEVKHLNWKQPVKCLRSDNGGEYISHSFETLMREGGIKHEFSSLNSPYQSGVPECQWRTLLEMGRCPLIRSGLPKFLWTCAIRMAAFIRNRCYNSTIEETPCSGQKPDLSKMYVFGSECHVYKFGQGKLDSKCDKGFYVGHGINSPAYLVYFPQSVKVQKRRVVKFALNHTADQQTQTLDDFDISDLQRN